MIRLPGLAIAALASLALLPAPANAYTFMSGADLAQRCLVDRTDPAQVGNFSFCVGYIRATFERMWVAEMEAGRRPQDCLPAEMTNQQIIDAVFAEMQRNPPANDVLASQVVRQALKAISPGCFS